MENLKILLIFMFFLGIFVKAQDSIKTINIQEVELISKKEIEGAALKKNNGFIHADSFYQNFAVLTRFKLSKKSKIISYNFYINSPNRQNKMPMKFVLYKEVDGVLEIVKIQDIPNYKKGFNQVSVSDLVLASDIYYFGLYWDMKFKENHIHPFKYDYYEENKLIQKNVIRYLAGPALGFKYEQDSINENYLYKDNNLQKRSNMVIYHNIEYR
jgi:hypothetical protein